VSDEQRDALQRLERRVEVLEQMVRRLLPARATPDVVPPSDRPRAAAAAPAPDPPRGPDLEQWFGQRGLLIVGVLALLAATAFFLKYAFDRGWMPPAARVALAVAAGIAVGAWGEGRLRGGLRRYGAALIGAGGGLIYLGLWAAAGPYALIDRRTGVLLLAGSTVMVGWLALRHEVEGLALWALVGAYLAPMLLRPLVPDPRAFLRYLEVVGLGTGLLAYVMVWRRTYDIALGGYLLLAAAGAAPALDTPLGCWFLAAAAILTLHVTRRRAWPEARVGVLTLTWVMTAAALSGIAKESQPQLWLALGAPAAIAALLWWQALVADPLRSREEAALFVANPFVLLALAGVAAPLALRGIPGALPLLLALLYLVPGWVRRTAPHLILGCALAAFALLEQWTPPSVVVGWTALALLALAAERPGGRPGGRVAALGLAMLALPYLFTVALWSRGAAATPFVDAWALAWYGYIAGSALGARTWGEPTAPSESAARGALRGAELLWALCGAAVFAGGTVELPRYFGRLAPLAGDLALSVFWLLYAGTLVRVGFALDRKDVRSTGLAVAAVAGLKIVLYDLANLEALYRIASFFALALIALVVAYAYNKKAPSESV